MVNSTLDMRDAFFKSLYTIAKNDKSVMLLSNDFGAPSLDIFRKELAAQYLNCGISEQNMISVAAGLALSEKKVYIYGILPFVTLRCLEQIKIDLCKMKLPVVIVGVGAGYAYESAGPTHHGIDDIGIMRMLEHLTILNASDSILAENFAEYSYRTHLPMYIRFDRGRTPLLYSEKTVQLEKGLAMVCEGGDICIVSTGLMTNTANEVAENLKKHSISSAVIDCFCLKPFNSSLFLEKTKKFSKIITLEEHLIDGGLGSIICETMADNAICKPIKRIAIPNNKAYTYSPRHSLKEYFGWDLESLTQTILKFSSNGKQ